MPVNLKFLFFLLHGFAKPKLPGRPRQGELIQTNPPVVVTNTPVPPTIPPSTSLPNPPSIPPSLPPTAFPNIPATNIPVEPASIPPNPLSSGIETALIGSFIVPNQNPGFVTQNLAPVDVNFRPSRRPPATSLPPGKFSLLVVHVYAGQEFMYTFNRYLLNTTYLQVRGC